MRKHLRTRDNLFVPNVFTSWKTLKFLRWFFFMVLVFLLIAKWWYEGDVIISVCEERCQAREAQMEAIKTDAEANPWRDYCSIFPRRCS